MRQLWWRLLRLLRQSRIRLPPRPGRQLDGLEGVEPVEIGLGSWHRRHRQIPSCGGHAVNGEGVEAVGRRR